MDPITLSIVSSILSIVQGIITWHNNQPISIQQEQAIQNQAAVDLWLGLPHKLFPNLFPAPLVIPGALNVPPKTPGA